LQWTKTFGNTTQYDYARDISVDEAGNVYVTGGSWGSWGTSIRPHTSGQYDAFVVRLDPITGDRVWNTFLGENLNSFGIGIASDPNGNLFITGDVFVPNSPQDVFIAALDMNGNALWFITAGSAGTNDRGKDIVMDNGGNIYVAGESWGTWGSPGTPFAGSADAFVLKLDNGGSVQWNTFLGASGADLAYGIDVDVHGNLYVSGASTDVWGNPFDSGTGYPQEVFAAKLDNNGNLVWNTYIQGEAWYQSAGHPNRIAEHNGSIYVVSLINTTYSNFALITKISDSLYDCLPDAFEPDNTLATGSPMTVGEVQRHTLCPQNDEDWVSFQVPPTLHMHRNYLVETFDLEPD
jgi:hypothetical protein